MAKIDFSKLRGLRNTNLLEAIANSNETHFIDSWNIVKDEVLRLSELAWNADLNGNKAEADKQYSAINLYFYIIHLNYSVNKYLARNKYSSINQETVDRFSLDCVKKNLSCLGRKYNTPLVKIWDELVPAPEGEFDPCEFEIQDFTEVTDISVYDACAVEPDIPVSTSITYNDFYLPSNEEALEATVLMEIFYSSDFPTSSEGIGSPNDENYSMRMTGYPSPYVYTQWKQDMTFTGFTTEFPVIIRDFLSNADLPIASFDPSGARIFKTVDNGDGTWTIYSAKVRKLPAGYNAVMGLLRGDVVGTSPDFGTGKANTAAMVAYLNGIGVTDAVPNFANDYYITKTDGVTTDELT